MAELKRTFTGGKMDKDTDERIVQNGLYREALNISVATSEDSDVGAAQNILGNTKVTEAIQHRTMTGGCETGLKGDYAYLNNNYHVATVVDPQTSMLYRFVHTASPIVPLDQNLPRGQGIWMDRIVEFDTSKNIDDPWYEKEKAVFVDIFKVETAFTQAINPCGGEIRGAGNQTKLFISSNINQIRWGMRAEIRTATVLQTATVIYVDYGNEIVYINNGNISVGEGEITFYGDRNLNFGSIHSNGLNIKPITGINIIDGMIFWTDNASEPKKINIERSKDGSSGRWENKIGRGVCKIDSFNQHTLLIANEQNVFQESIVDTSCEVGGCTDPTAQNYEPLATSDNGSCNYHIFGCMDKDADNYDQFATFDDGTCCSITGCWDNSYCEYVQGACAGDQEQECLTMPGCTDSGNLFCEEVNGQIVCDEALQQSWWIENNYNITTGIPTYPGIEACNYNEDAGCDNGSCEYISCTEDPTFDYVCDASGQTPCEENPKDITPRFYSMSDCESAYANDGCCADDRVLGCMIDGFVQTNFNATCHDPTMCLDECDYGCTDPMATNYNSRYTCDDGSCTYISSVDGCTDENAQNFDSNATNDDGSCYGTIGCTDVNGCEYDADNVDVYNDNSTPDPSLTDCGGYFGCTDTTASNYDSGASCDDGSCTYTFTYGCTDDTASNYDPSATADNGTCCVNGCMDNTFVEYNSLATCDSTLTHAGTGPCATLISSVTGCTLPGAFNEGTWDYACTDHLGSTNGTAADANGVYTCCEPVILGCTDPNANNPTLGANTNDGTCTYPSACAGLTYDVQIPLFQPTTVSGGVQPSSFGSNDVYSHEFFGPSPSNITRATATGSNSSNFSSNWSSIFAKP